MPRRRRSAAGMDSVQELARKVAILEREMALQQQALERLKEMGARPRAAAQNVVPLMRKSA